MYVIIDCVGAGIATLVSIFDGLHPYFFLSIDGKDAVDEKELDGEVFICRQSRYFRFVENMIELLFPTCTLNWLVNNNVSRQRKCIKMRNEGTIIIYIFVAFWYCGHFLKSLLVCLC